MGRPTTKKGHKLYKKHSYYEPVRTHSYIINAIRKWFKDHTRPPNCFVCREPVTKDRVSLKTEGRSLLHFHTACSERAYKIVFPKSNTK